MKKCPYCAEEIQDQAIKCKHCGSNLNPPNSETPKQDKPKHSLILPISLILIGIVPMFISKPLLFLSIIMIGIGLSWLIIPRLRKQATDLYCPACETVGRPKMVTPGSMGVEIVLWLFFIIPGLIYSVWRLTAKKEVCPACGKPGMIPLESPKALRDLSQFR